MEGRDSFNSTAGLGRITTAQKGCRWGKGRQSWASGEGANGAELSPFSHEFHRLTVAICILWGPARSHQSLAFMRFSSLTRVS